MGGMELDGRLPLFISMEFHLITVMCFREEIMNNFISKLAVFIYAGLCFYLAILGMPAELAGFIIAGALSLAFLNLESFAEFSGAGFSAKN